MKRTAFLCSSPETIAKVYGQGRLERLASLSALAPGVATGKDDLAKLKEVEALFSTWGMPALSAAQLDAMPSLKAVFYAAGSVKGFAQPLLERGIAVFSAWAANAIPVAEFTAAQIILANKGFFRNSSDSKNPKSRLSGGCFVGRGNYGATVALLGAGQIGRKVIELLKPCNLRIVVFDPYLTAEGAKALGVERVSLEDAFRQAYVVSNHLANVPATKGLLNRKLLDTLCLDATFINTGRGATVVESDLIAVLQSRPDLFALLDVTDPEPPVESSPFYTLPNVLLTSHIAGSLNDEVVRMADYMLEEFQAWESGRPLRYQVTLAMLDHMA